MVLIILITMNNRKEYFMRHLTVLVVLLALLSGCNIDENTKNMTTTEVESKTVESINEEAIQSNDENTGKNELVEDSSDFDFKSGDVVEISKFLKPNVSSKFSEGYLKDTYWFDSEELNTVLLINIIERESTSNIFKEEVVDKYLTKESKEKYLSDYELNKDYNIEYIKALREATVYDEYAIRPFYTEYKEYIGVESKIRYSSFMNLTSEETFDQFDVFDGQYLITYDYYRNEEGDYQHDNKGYYKKYSNDNDNIIMNEGQLVNINHYIDYSYDDSFSRVQSDNGYGNTKWTNDHEMNKALFSFLIYSRSFDTRFKEEFIVDYIAEYLAKDKISIYRERDSAEFYDTPYSEIRITKYNGDDIYTITAIDTAEEMDKPNSYEDLIYEYYVIKLPNGKYDFCFTEFDLIDKYGDRIN